MFENSESRSSMSFKHFIVSFNWIKLFSFMHCSIICLNSTFFAVKRDWFLHEAFLSSYWWSFLKYFKHRLNSLILSINHCNHFSINFFAFSLNLIDLLLILLLQFLLNWLIFTVEEISWLTFVVKKIFRLSKFLKEFNNSFQLISRITLIKSCKISCLKRLTKWL